MKKNAIIILLIAFAFGACVAKKADNCATLSHELTEAANVYITDPTKANCEAYVKSIKDYFNGCAMIPAASRASYQAWLDATNCEE